MAPAFSLAGLGFQAIGRSEAHPPSRAVTGGDVTNGAVGAETSRRRSCFANSRLLQLPRLRWASPRWHRLPPRPGAAGMVAGTMAGAGVARASSSAAPLITRAAMVTAVAM